MTKEWTEFFIDLAWVSLWLVLIPILIFIAYLVDLRFQPVPLEIVEGGGKKQRADPRKLHIEDRR